MKGIVLFLSLMVGGLINWAHATNLDERPKKHLFVTGNNFQINEFQEISGIIGNNSEIVGIKPVEKNEVGNKRGIPTVSESSQEIFKPASLFRYNV